MPQNTLPFPSSPIDEPARYETVRRRLDKAVRKVCPAHLADRADDLVQTAMMRVMEKCRQAPDSQFNDTYLHRTAYHALVDEIRRLRRRGEVGIDDEEGEPLPLAVDRPDPEQRALGRQLGEAIAACLKRLVEARQRAVTLHLQGHSVPEAAKILDWSRKRVENLVYRGLADLRQCLELKGVTP